MKLAPKKMLVALGISAGVLAAPLVLPALAMDVLGEYTSVEAKEQRVVIDSYGLLKKCAINGTCTLPDKVTAIGKTAFDEGKITSFKVSQSHNAFQVVDGALLSKDGTILIRVPNQKSGTYTVPNSVRMIASDAFRGCKLLTSVQISDRVYKIGGGAFYGCGSLTSVKIPAKVTVLGKEMFYGCGALTEITLPNKLTALGQSAFADCTSLTSIAIPTSVTKLCQDTFNGCTSLTTVKLPAKLQSISARAFEGCSSLRYIVFPDGLSKIGHAAFYECSSLENLILPKQLETIGSNAFMGCTGVKHVSIPAKVNSIAYAAFCECGEQFSVASGNENYSCEDGVLFNKTKTKLLYYPYAKAGSYEIGEEITDISRYAFVDCAGLTKLTIPDSIRELNLDSFSGCSVKELNLGSDLKNLHNSYQADLPKLEKIIVAKDNPYYTTFDDALYSKDKTKLLVFPGAATGKRTFPKEARNLDALPRNNQVSSFAVEKDQEYFAVEDGVLTNAAKTRVICIPTKIKKYTLGNTMRNVSEFSYAKEYLSDFQAYEVKPGNPYFKAESGVLYESDKKTLVDYPNARKGDFKVGQTVRRIKHGNTFAYAKYLKNLVFESNIKSCELSFVECPALEGIYIRDESMKSLSLFLGDGAQLSRLSCTSFLKHAEFYSNQPQENLVVYGCEKSGLQLMAKKKALNFVSLGTVPAKMQGVTIGYVLDSSCVRLSWQKNPQAEGYIVMTSEGKKWDIADPDVTQKSIYAGKSYYVEISICPYSTINGKRVYGDTVTKSLYRSDY